jgi:hypothetical protein
VGVPDGDVLAGGVLDGVDCAHATEVSPRAIAARAIACKTLEFVLMHTSRAKTAAGAAPLRSII